MAQVSVVTCKDSGIAFVSRLIIDQTLANRLKQILGIT